MCFDETRFRTVGAVSVDPIHWINRPTWQQVVEVQGHRGRSPVLRAATRGGPAVSQGKAAKKCQRKGKKKHRAVAEAAKKKKKKSCAKRKRKKKR